MNNKSCGQQLFHDKKLKQASCFFGNLINEDIRKVWLNSLPKPELRTKIKKFKDDVLCVILSQDCDIACNKDENDDSVEIALCQPIKEKNVFVGNQFVRSVRKFQFLFQTKNYEAQVDYILTVKKIDLLNIINSFPDNSIFNLDYEYKIALPYWRSNRYLRSALPDKFNEALSPLLEEYIPRLTEKSNVDKTIFGYSSLIKAFYVNINSLEELNVYDFEFFFLLRDETPNEILSEIQDIVEEMAENFSKTSGFNDTSEIFVGKESSTTVGYLSSLIRFNVDHYSLKQGDVDFSPNC
ncbi:MULTISPECIES: hypothetical protein [Acinetobacter calcoaceticus/baumannii complex]|uniref:hypothetical protein n=1 Tax=Acinetobacter calcoaceticus/baumannii complex TaxID=909768 RepID=UPI00233F95E5|nr:hypothetical protein [Acinetobacter baumannii]MDC5353535.1 hypothetical protein [Acinetobacter baumannii]MDK2220594.1 hypothetical protein [Acinetobacter baumannii]MDK2231459.1 hypothetical protein [Acinetobacter baumannii]HCQ9865999.1 hypothetical protein [Acinetobacter baumannii]